MQDYLAKNQPNVFLLDGYLRLLNDRSRFWLSNSVSIQTRCHLVRVASNELLY